VFDVTNLYSITDEEDDSRCERVSHRVPVPVSTVSTPISDVPKKKGTKSVYSFFRKTKI
jgi:hypothetical protein